jgi:hypothetical protein
MAQTPSKKPTPEQLKKLAEGYRYITIPATDIYDYPFDGIHIQGGTRKDGTGALNLHFMPGKHLVAPDIADEVESRLKIWQDSMLRLMRPTAHRKSQEEATRRGMAIVENPEAME